MLSKILASAEDVLKPNIQTPKTSEENGPKASSSLSLRQFVFVKSTENNMTEIYTTGILTGTRY